MRRRLRLGKHGRALACASVLLAAHGCSRAPAELVTSDAGLPDAGHAPAAPPVRPALCARPGADAVRDVFCADEPPALDSLHALQERLNLVPYTLDDPAGRNGRFALPVLLALSTALSGHLVSQLNPRAIIMGPNLGMAFQRGVQEVELMARTRGKPEDVRFYLVRFQQACSARGCSAAQLYTPEIEAGWTRVEVSDADDLANTPFDCKQCHQRGSAAPSLLMRELQGPWTHFFDAIPQTDIGTPLPGVRGYDLMRDYLAAKGGEAYAGIDSERYVGAAALTLQSMVDRHQPLFFDAKRIETERWPYGPDGYPSAPLPSPTWQRAYEAFRRGEQLALPHYDARPTDPDKQAALTAAYQRWQRGETRELPDLSDIYPDDPRLRAELGLQVEPDATPEDALIQACAPCHNDVLDQSLSRARFNVDLSRLPAAELEQAITRLRLPRTAAGAMPPARARALDDATRQRLLAYLEQVRSEPAQSPALAHAAAMGMSGGGGPSFSE